MNTIRMCGALSIRRPAMAEPSGNSPAIPPIIHRPAGSASTHRNQIRKPPSTPPQVLPDPPTITITQIRKVNRRGW